MAVSVRISLLGGFRVEVDGQLLPPDTWRHSRARQLIALLALSPAHRLHREQVMDALWPSLAPDAAGANLRKAIHFARRALGQDQITTSQSLVRLGSSEVWIDVDAFDQAAARGDTEAALDLHRGELLPEDRFEPWAERPHGEVRRTLIQLLVDRAHELERAGDRSQAAAALERLVGEDPLNEAAHCDPVRLHALDGNRHVALRWYRHLEDTLRDELGLEPGAEARRLYDDVCAGRLLPSPPTATPAGDVAATIFEDRRIVTVLAAEVSAVVQSDPELHARALEVVVDSVRAVVEAGGGVVEARVGT